MGAQDFSAGMIEKTKEQRHTDEPEQIPGDEDRVPKYPPKRVDDAKYHHEFDDVFHKVYFRQYTPRRIRTNSSVKPPGFPTRCLGRNVPAQSMPSVSLTCRGVNSRCSFPT